MVKTKAKKEALSSSNESSKEKKQKQEDPDIDDIVEDKEEPVDEDDIDETYSDLDDDELLALALRDDEEEATEKPPKKEGAADEKKSKKRKKQTYSKSNVLYLGHIPHGFFEEQIKAFLQQFGKVVQVRVSRSSKTGNSRGYAFVQFLHKEVADIVQKTMHGYILTGRSLVCQHVPEEHVHEKMFLGGLSGKNSVVNTYPEARKKRVLAHGVRSTTEKGEKRRSSRLIKADKRRKETLARKGIKYDFSGYEQQK